MSESQQAQLVFTYHGTVLYVTDDGELRHGRLSPCRSKNLRLVQNDSQARLIHVNGGIDSTIRCGPTGCWSTATETKIRPSEAWETLNVVRDDSGSFALEWQSRYLSALADGSIMLTAPHLKEWETFREGRAQLRDKPRVAGMTMVYNEPVFLPIWERYYAQQLGYENLFLIDHGTDDGSTQNSRIPNRINLPRDHFDEDQRSAFISGLQASLLNYFDAVIFADVDEIVVADPGCYSGILDYCTTSLDRFVTTVGLEVLNFPEAEQSLDLNRPILEQRRFVRFSAWYCKPVLAEIPLRWPPGFHSCQYPARLDPRLFLFHLKLMDQGLALLKLAKTKKLPWSESALRQGHGIQQRFDDDKFLSSFYPAFPDAQRSHQNSAFTFEEELRSFNPRRVYQYFIGEPKVLPQRFLRVIPAPTPPAGMNVAESRDLTSADRSRG